MSISRVILLSLLLAACGFAEYPPPQYTLVLTADTTLVEDVRGSVAIRADNVTLDCGGHAITGRDTGAEGLWDDIGILVDGVSGVTIKNCVVSGFGYGIELKSWSGLSERNRVLGNTLTSNVEDGVLLIDSDLNVVRGNTASLNGEHGFAVLGDVNLLEGNRAFGNDGDGFAIGEGYRDNTFDANTATRNGGNGFGIAGTGHIFERNAARDNGVVGFAAVTGSGDITFGANTATENESTGSRSSSPVATGWRGTWQAATAPLDSRSRSAQTAIRYMPISLGRTVRTASASSLQGTSSGETPPWEMAVRGSRREQIPTRSRTMRRAAMPSLTPRARIPTTTGETTTSASRQASEGVVAEDRVRDGGTSSRSFANRSFRSSHGTHRPHWPPRGSSCFWLSPPTSGSSRAASR